MRLAMLIAIAMALFVTRYTDQCPPGSGKYCPGKVALSIDHNILKKALALPERRRDDADDVAHRLKQIIDSRRST